MSVVTVCLMVAAVGAHDFWLVPDAFAVAIGQELVLKGQTSSAFPTSESAVTVDRLVDARVIGAADQETITGRSTEGQSLVLRQRPRTPGQKVVTASLDWRNVNETAASFRQYLVLEGADDALKRLEQEGRLPTGPIVRRYAKYAKTIVEYGEGPRAFDRVAGQPLEFVPLADPSQLEPSTMLRVRLLFQGKPLANARVHAGRAPAEGTPDTVDIELRSSLDGVVTVPLGTSGLWNVRSLHVAKAPSNADADWDVHWASYVFRVK